MSSHDRARLRPTQRELFHPSSPMSGSVRPVPSGRRTAAAPFDADRFPGFDLRRHRERMGWSIAGLALELDVHTSTVRRWERRERLPGPGHVLSLARALHLPIPVVASFFDAVRETAATLEPESVRAPGLRRIRRGRDVSARHVAALLGVPVSTVYNWETGSARLPLGHLATLSHAWGVDADVLRAAVRLPDRHAQTPQPSPLRRMRRVCGLSQAQVADRLGVSRYSVGRWEAGQRPPLHALRGLARLYGRTVTVVAAAAGAGPARVLDPRTWRPGDLPEVLRTLREWSGLTQGEVARRCGCSPDAVRGWERARAVPRLTHRAALENLYRLETGALLACYPP